MRQNQHPLPISSLQPGTKWGILKEKRRIAMALINITKDNFHSLVKESPKPVLLDFWATWCGPCKMIAPMVDALSAQREDVVFGKVNVDEEPELASAFGISSIPTLVLVRDGKITATAVGYRPQAEIEKLLDK